MRAVGLFFGVNALLMLVTLVLATAGIGLLVAFDPAAAAERWAEWGTATGDLALPALVGIAAAVLGAVILGIWTGRALWRLDPRARWPALLYAASLLLPGGLSMLAGGVAVAVLIDGGSVLRADHARLRAQTPALDPDHPLGGRRWTVGVALTAVVVTALSAAGG